MGYLSERVAYLKGLVEGMQINDASNEGKLIKAIIDVLDDFALTIEDMEEVQDHMNEQMESIDENLAKIEEAVFGDEDDEYYCDDEIECPHCGEAIDIDDIVLDKDTKSFECPNCHKKIDVEWECECDDDDDDDHDDSDD